MTIKLPYPEPLVPIEPASGRRRLEAIGMALPLWEDVLPNVTDEQLADAARQVAAGT